MKVKALSVRQPWAWLVANGWKNVENRTWGTSHRGPFLVHASSTMTAADYEACRIFVNGMSGAIFLPEPEDLLRGGIVGASNLLDCVDHHTNEWFTGPKGYVLDESFPAPFVPLKGRLGFFDVEWEGAVAAAFRSQLVDVEEFEGRPHFLHSESCPSYCDYACNPNGFDQAKALARFMEAIQ